MASLDSLQVRELNKEGLAIRRADDSSKAIRLFYVGSGTVTSVTVTTGTNIAMVTSDGGTDTYAFATYTTVGTLVAAINADGIFKAYVVDALRADLTTSKFKDGAITAGADEDGVACWDVLGDTDAQDYATVTLTPRGIEYAAKAAGHRVQLHEIKYNQNVNAAMANGVRVYKRKGTVETQIWGAASVDATETTHNWGAGMGFISAGPDEELIVRVIDTTSITDATANFIEVLGFRV